MTQFASDSFTGADGTSLSTYNPAWARVAAGGLMALLGNRVRQSGSTTAVYAFMGTPAPAADYDVSANIYIGSTSGTPSVGVCGRMAGADDLTFYQARITLGSGIVLARFIGNTATTLATIPYTPVLNSEPKLTLRMRGDQLSVLLDDVVVIGPITDATITDAGYAGIRMASASSVQVHIDNLTATTVDSAAASVAAQVAWTDADDVASLASLLVDRATLSWTEQGDSAQLQGVVANAAPTSANAALAWDEAGDVAAIVVRVSNRGAMAYAEQGDGWTLAAFAKQPSVVNLSVRFDALPRNFNLKTVHYSN